MTYKPETLLRLCRVFFPEMPAPSEWCGRLADVFSEYDVDDVDVIGYFHAMFLHHRGLAPEDPVVASSVSAPFVKLEHFGSRVTLVVAATNSARWLERIMDFYQDIGVRPVFAIDGKTSDETREILFARGATCIHAGAGLRGDLLSAVFNAVETDWILHIEDDELPTPALLKFVDKAVKHATSFEWGFPRIHCRYDDSTDELRYSQFLAFGPLANAELQRRLVSRDDGPKERRSATADAIVLNFGWVARSFAERVEQLRNRAAGGWASLGSFSSMCEAVPDNWHLWTCLRDERYKEIARAIHRSKTESNKNTQEAPAWRDRIVMEAAAHMGRMEIAQAEAWLRRLEHTTIDGSTLEMTDPYLAPIARGRKVVASFDPSRRPTADEVVIVYGNYPHMYENVVVNNPIRRHVVDFWKFRHDEVESDHRWAGVDQIFVINMDERPDRYYAVLRELASARAPFDRVTRVAAVKPAPGDMTVLGGAIACLRSHIATLRRAQAAQYEHVLVLEDDFCFTSDLEQHLTDLADFFNRGYAYWICLFATSKYGAIVPRDDLISVSFQPVTNAAGHLVSREGIERLLPVFEAALERLQATGDCTHYAADRCWAVLQPSGKFLVFRRKFGFQVANFSDIERTIARYLD